MSSGPASSGIEGGGIGWSGAEDGRPAPLLLSEADRIAPPRLPVMAPGPLPPAEAAQPPDPAPAPETAPETAPEPAATRPLPEPAPLPEADPRAATEAWEALETVKLDRRHLGRTRVISLGRTDPAHAAFDMLRTRMLHALRERGWSRVGVTSPTKGCGKTFVAANLAISLARQARCRTLLMDLDLRIPSLARALGIRGKRAIEEMLRGEVAAEDFLLRPAPNLAVALNTRRKRDSAEFLQDPETAAALARLRARYRPDVVLYDLPPMLACDDVVGFLPQIDGLLLVIGGGITRAEDVTRCERLIEDHGPFLGVIMNRAEDPAMERYTYG